MASEIKQRKTDALSICNDCNGVIKLELQDDGLYQWVHFNDAYENESLHEAERVEL